MIEQRSKAWHEQRAGRLTGSMFAAALGLSPYCSRQKAWRLLTGRQEQDAENAAMAHGTAMEPVAIAWYEEQTGNLVTPSGFVQHGEYLGVSPDGLVGGDGCIEVKAPIAAPHDHVPEHYLPQCLGVMHILKREWLDFISYHADGQQCFRLYAEETRDQWKVWEAELVDFYERYVLGDTEPPRKTRSKKNG